MQKKNSLNLLSNMANKNEVAWPDVNAIDTSIPI